MFVNKITHFHWPLPIHFYPFHNFYEVNLYLKTAKVYYVGMSSWNIY